MVKRVIYQKDLFIKKLLFECLMTHNLTKDNIIYGIEIIYNIIKYDDDQRLSLLIIHLYKRMNSGKFSLYYNLHIDKAIISLNKQQLIKLIKFKKEEFWPEVYSNLSLTSNERQILINQHKKEHIILLNVINQSDLSVTNILTGSLFEKCYQQLLIEERVLNNNLKITDNIDQFNDIILIPECIDDINIITCFNLIELIEGLTRNPPINIKTKELFSKKIGLKLGNKYKKEIKMVKYFKNLKYFTF